MNIKKIAVLFAHGLVGWAACGAIIGIFRSITSMENTLIIHAIGVPVIFGLLSLLYFSKFNYTTPMQTAVFFFSFAILMDVFVIAIFVEKSFAMFASILGTWIPFALIFLSTYLVGSYTLQKKRRMA
jgi:peptidoglycan biosynthesis protein MviN/MurJ (putative lipid II flippase)